MDVKDKFDKNVKILTLCLSIAFCVRISSPVGWIPLLLCKIFKDGSFKPFLIAGLTITVPVYCASIVIDSLYYGQFTIAGYAFYKFNILENKSRLFGVNPPDEYIRLFIPNAMKYAFPLFLGGIAIYLKQCSQKKVPPYFIMFILTFIGLLSKIEHKE